MTSQPYDLDWANTAFSKTAQKAIAGLKATFIAAPREISEARFTQLIKQYLPAGQVVLGISKEPYVLGFEGQPQFRTLNAKTVQDIIKKVNASKTPHKIYTLAYHQREAKHVLGQLKFQRIILVNGSWKYAFHTQEPFYALLKRGTPYEFVSPFASEEEARQYETAKQPEVTAAALAGIKPGKMYDSGQMLGIAGQAAKLSYDYSFQTGTALGKPKGGKYELLAHSFNKVVPFQTYAMHYGASREQNFSPPQDLNHYDTVHAEVELIIKAQKDGISLKGTTLFINLMPCPTCSRMLAETDIEEVVYAIDHSEGYAVRMLEAAGKKVRRIVP